LRKNKASGAFTNGKPDHAICFQLFTQKTNESAAKLSGNITSTQVGTMLYAQQNAAITDNRRMAASVLLKALFEAAQARKRRKK